tara:strand:- start:179 stop:373 length:195 start_codon:yes stop_codon:yes gene_type:complete
MYQPLERATGTLKAKIRGSQNRIGELYQEGSSRLFFLKTFLKLRNVLLLIQLAVSQEVISLRVR